MKSLWIVLWVVPFALTGCSREAPVDGAAYTALAQMILHRRDQIDAEMLADWLIQEKKDFLLIDIRSQRDFAAGHIPTARNLPLSYLVERQTRKGLPKDRKLILYADGNRKASQAVVLLRLAGFDAYGLLGGYRFWQARVLHPELPADAGDDEKRAFRKRQAVACHFSGNEEQAEGFTPRLQKKPPTRKAQEPVLLQEGC